jgi:hypothetical protein
LGGVYGGVYQNPSHGNEEFVAVPAMRFGTCAGVLAAGLLFGAGNGIALADTGATSGNPPEGASVSSTWEETPTGSGAGSESRPDTDRPTSTVGDGRSGTEPKSSSDADTMKPDPDRTQPTSKFKHTGWRNPRPFVANREIPVPTSGDCFAALEPTPEPTPGPALRTQEVAPAVADSTGRSVAAVANAHVAPPVLHAPLVVTPVPISLPISWPVSLRAVKTSVVPLGSSTGAGSPQPLAVDTAAGGIQTQVIRGSLPPAAPAKPAATSLAPMSEQATRGGNGRYLRNPTAGELAAVALPGVAGLLFLTFSGGFIGYRQANSVRFIRTEDAGRFLR